jgi:hypothetical protein
VEGEDEGEESCGLMTAKDRLANVRQPIYLVGRLLSPKRLITDGDDASRIRELGSMHAQNGRSLLRVSGLGR